MDSRAEANGNLLMQAWESHALTPDCSKNAEQKGLVQ